MTYFVWDLYPEIFRWGPLAVRWYGPLFAQAFFSGHTYMGRRAGPRPVPLETDALLLYLISGALLALVHLENFFNSEIVGEVIGVPWAVIFSRVDALPRHPVQLYESFA